MVMTADKPQTYIYKKEEDKQYRVGMASPSYSSESYEDKLKRLSKYEPVIPQAPLDERFHGTNPDGSLYIKAKLGLIKTVDELKAFAKKCVGKTVALDTETTGLTFGEDVIVGFSLALNDMEGYYVPIRHRIRNTTVVKENKVDKDGNFVLTKTGRISQQSIKTHTYEPYLGNLPDKECLDILYDIMLKSKMSIWHNSEFDLNMLKFEGYDVTKCKTFDTLLLPYIYDAEAKGIAGLKPLEKRLLGRYRLGFKETVGSDENFQFTDPEKTYAYAALDSTNTFGIYQKLLPMTVGLLKQAPDVIQLDEDKKYNIIQEDNNLVRAFVDYYGHAKLKINSDEAKAYELLVKDGLANVTEEIFAFFGRGPFSLSTQSKEFKSVMESAHIETGALTEKGKTTAYGKTGIKEFNKNMMYLKNNVFPNVKYLKFNVDNRFGSKLPKSGQSTRALNTIVGNLVRIMKTYSKDYCKLIDQVNNLVIKNKDGSYATREDFYYILKNMYHGEMKKLNILQKIKEYSSFMKALTSYISKLTEVTECRMRYRLQGTSSGRLSSGNSSKTKSKENKYYINLNAQNLTKPKQVFYEATPSLAPDNILGYKFEHVSDDYAHEHQADKIIVEAGAPKANIRKCIEAPEGRYIVSLDFCVSPETTVELEDGSIKPITVLENNPQRIKTPMGYELAHNFHYTGKRQKCVLTLKSGRKITCSPDHKFLVKQEDGIESWKALKDITGDDSIIEDVI